MSRVHHLESTQTIPCSIDGAWSFFSNAKNLLAITPPFLNLIVTNKVSEGEIFKGQIIAYSVKPLLGIPLKWLTEITDVEPEKMFVDEQVKGPYKLWRHQHNFIAVEGGVKMRDLVDYSLPFASFGELAHGVVRNQLRKIFEYRYHKIEELFGKWDGQLMDLKFT